MGNIYSSRRDAYDAVGGHASGLRKCILEDVELGGKVKSRRLSCFQFRCPSGRGEHANVPQLRADVGGVDEKPGVVIFQIHAAWLFAVPGVVEFGLIVGSFGAVVLAILRCWIHDSTGVLVNVLPARVWAVRFSSTSGFGGRILTGWSNVLSIFGLPLFLYVRWSGYRS